MQTCTALWDDESVTICTLCECVWSCSNWVTTWPSAIHFLSVRTKRDLLMDHLVSRCITRSSLFLSLLLAPLASERTPDPLALTPGKLLDPRRQLALLSFVKSISSAGMIKVWWLLLASSFWICVCTRR